MNSRCDRYAVMGNPIAHSKSPRIHTLFAQQTRQELTYDAILVDTGSFAQAVDEFRQSGGKGVNVTVPFKQDAWELADHRSAGAELAGAINTLSFYDNQCHGDNTDGTGLVRDLVCNLSIKLKDKKLLVLGAGGAVRGVLEPLLEQKPGKITVANRTSSKARELAAHFASHGNIIGTGYDDLERRPFDVIINGTAASLQGNVPPVAEACVGRGTCLYDMMYRSDPTPFMLWGTRLGAGSCFDGLGMLVEQAAESFAIWRGVRPDTIPVIRQLRIEMEGVAEQ